MNIKDFIAKLFKIKTTIEYKAEHMGIPVPPGTKLYNNYFFIENLGKTTIYVSGIPRAFPENVEPKFIGVEE